MLIVAFIVHLHFLGWNLCVSSLASVVRVLDSPFPGLSPSREGFTGSEGFAGSGPVSGFHRLREGLRI